MNYFNKSTEGIVENVVNCIITYSYKYCVSQSFVVTSHLFSRYLTTSVEISYPVGTRPEGTSCIEEFIKQKTNETFNHFRITPARPNFTMEYYMNHRYGMNDKLEEENEEPSLDIEKQLTPIPNNWSIFFWYKGKFIRVFRNSLGSDPQISRGMETLKITAYLTRNKNVLVEMLTEARKMAENNTEKFIKYYQPTRGGYRSYDQMWSMTRRVHTRSLSSIILREGVTNAIQEDIEDFLKNRQWYKERSIPYRRGYLLYGPPGCGKTSFVKAIAGQIGFNIYEISLSDGHINDQSLNGLLSSFGRKTILLFEDIDAVFGARSKEKEEKDENKNQFRRARHGVGVTFSGLLNAIDGVVSKEDYIIFMTTNHIGNLDSALIRPGRIDLKQLIDYPDEKQIATFFQLFYPNCNVDLPSKFAKAVKNVKNDATMAQIQGVFLKHKKEPEDTLLDVGSLIEVSDEQKKEPENTSLNVESNDNIFNLDSALIHPGRIDLKEHETQMTNFVQQPSKFAKTNKEVTINAKDKIEPEDTLLDVDSLIEVCGEQKKEPENTSLDVESNDHIFNLDSALIHPGRFDLKQHETQMTNFIQQPSKFAKTNKEVTNNAKDKIEPEDTLLGVESLIEVSDEQKKEPENTSLDVESNDYIFNLDSVLIHPGRIDSMQLMQPSKFAKTNKEVTNNAKDNIEPEDSSLDVESSGEVSDKHNREPEHATLDVESSGEVSDKHQREPDHAQAEVESWDEVSDYSLYSLTSSEDSEYSDYDIYW